MREKTRTKQKGRCCGLFGISGIANDD